ncbi:metal ABC transporter ATP-binding protein [Kamptonema formosum]|uniref:metal ABC transporter ATP-binding protein n=1 Tax=Kamptonema formosum TaxID=331992 RepID=UPI00034AFA13|nr:ABC transporter ATP-binding protein [Oscillatoria sp. PCC 10802]
MNSDSLNGWHAHAQSKIPNSQLPTLKVENLTAYQGTYLALREVSFELPAGTDTAVVGPNGAGKSTLAQAILGLIPRKSGRIEMFGRPLERLGPLCHQIGYVPQNFIFDRSFPISVWELVGLGWVKQRNPQSKIENPKFKWPWQPEPEKSAAIAGALQRVGAYQLRHQAIGTLSGGQLKRVLLAYCLVMPRRLLVLDEAFAGVDAQGEADFYALLNELKREHNWTVLQVSHDLDMVSRHCDRVICLNQTVVCTGKPEIALAPQNLLATYGPTLSRYRHTH